MDMHDILSKTDVKHLVDEFYKKVVIDPIIGFIFVEVVELSLQKHLPIMYSFWNSILLGSNSYQGNAMIKHMELNQKITLNQDYFDRWLNLWGSTVNENFSGPKASEAISRAKNIAALIQHKIAQNHQTF